jgi:hypothetical protein
MIQKMRQKFKGGPAEVNQVVVIKVIIKELKNFKNNYFYS